MLYKIEYTDQISRQVVIENNKDKILIEEQNVSEGNYLIFTDTPRLDEQLAQIKEDNLILMDAMATTFEEILNLQAQIGGTA